MLRSSCESHWNYHKPRRDYQTVARVNCKRAIVRRQPAPTVQWCRHTSDKQKNNNWIYFSPFCMQRGKWMRTMKKLRGNYRMDGFGYRMIFWWMKPSECQCSVAQAVSKEKNKNTLACERSTLCKSKISWKHSFSRCIFYCLTVKETLHSYQPSRRSL